MSKIKSLSELGDLYGTIQESAVNQPAIDMGNNMPDILLTDATQYVPAGKAPKTGSAFGKEDGIEEVAKGTGPEAADNFDKKLAKEADLTKAGEATKGVAKETKKETKEKREALPDKEEKVEETVDSASKTPKYKKQQFIMPKSKFQQLYEDAMQKGPFVKEEEEMAPIAPAADDTSAEIDAEPTGTEEKPLTHEEIIEMLEKALEALKKHAGYEDTHGGKDISAGGEEETAHMEDSSEEEEEEEESAMEEAVDAEDLGHPLEGAKSEELKDGNKIHKVGGSGVTKVKGAASEQGANFKNEPAPKKEKESAHLKDGHKLHTVGSLKPTKGEENMFTQ